VDVKAYPVKGSSPVYGRYTGKLASSEPKVAGVHVSHQHIGTHSPAHTLPHMRPRSGIAPLAQSMHSEQGLEYSVAAVHEKTVLVTKSTRTTVDPSGAKVVDSVLKESTLSDLGRCAPTCSPHAPTSIITTRTHIHRRLTHTDTLHSDSLTLPSPLPLSGSTSGA